MSLGISDFRALVTTKSALENRRVTVEDEMPGQQTIRAPSSLWGRVVDWFTDGAVGPNIGRENREARQTFYDALVKSNGKDFADRILQDTVGMDGDTFAQSTATLRASTIKRVIDAADTRRDALIVRTHQDAMAFTQTGLADAARNSQAGQANPGARFDDPELGKVFWNLVRADPDFGRKLFTRQDIDAIVERAVTQYVEKRGAQFTEQFPGLAGLGNTHLRDKESYFDEVRADLGRPPLSGLSAPGVNPVYKDWMQQSLAALQDSQDRLARMDFKPEEAGRLKRQLEGRLADMQDLARQGQASEGFGAANIATYKRTAEIRLAEDTGRKTLLEDIFPSCTELGLQLPEKKALGEAYADAFKKCMGAILKNGGSLGDAEQQQFLRQELSTTLHQELGKLGIGEDQRNITVNAALDRLQERIGAGAATLTLPEATRTSAEELHGALMNDLERQISVTRAKIEFLDEYMQNDPLSDKNVAYNKLVWTQASALALKDAADDLRGKLDAALQRGDHASAHKLTNHLAATLEKKAEANLRMQDAREEWEHAGTERSVSPREKDYSGTHPLKQHRKDEEKFLKDAFEHAKLKPEGDISAYLAKRQIKALDTVQDWHTIERKMFVQRDGVARTYTSEIRPGSQIGHGVGNLYGGDGLKGVSAANKTEAGHARNLQISALYRDEIGPGGEQLGRVKVSQTIRHGVLDAWNIKDPTERRDASRAGAKEVLTTAMVSDEQFLARAKANSQANLQDGNHPVSKLVHINLNLTTADSLLVRKMSPDYREYDFTRNQFDAFASHTGPNTLTADGQNVNLDVDTITLSFGVNAVALGEGAPWALALESSRWPEDIVQHNKENLEKLVGDLGWGSAPGGYVGGIVDRLREKASDPDTPANEVEQINAAIGKIQRETDRVRRMFNGEEYKNGIEDAYKMDRHIMSLVNTTQDALANLLGDRDMMMTLSQGCKSNKDRGGMGDVEHKAQVIIEDMGGQVNPSEEFSEQDQIIYNTVLTSSGQAEVQQLNTGLPGSKNAGEVKARINDPDAVNYAKGFADFTKA
jgi:hypothetical protein